MARMPSTRPQPLNPGAAVPSRAPAPAGKDTKPAPGTQSKAPEEPPADDETEAQRNGGFHESSYELRHGLEVNESEWPADTTIPGALGDR
jgi:hypothetical protein